MKYSKRTAVSISTRDQKHIVTEELQVPQLTKSSNHNNITITKIRNISLTLKLNILDRK